MATRNQLADEAVLDIWSAFLKFYTSHFRGPNIAVSAADQTAFYEIAQPIMRKLANLGPVPMNYIFNKDYPLNPGDEFMGLYAEADGYAHLVLKVAKEPIFPFRFTTTNGGPPHFIGDPIAWAPLPIISATAPTPVEHAVSKMHSLQIPQDMMHRMELQSREFETLDEVVRALKNLPAVVDDDYPEMRHKYDSALTTFLEACKANGRFERLRKQEKPSKPSQTELEARGYRGD
jgi:hypothetical protein